MPKVVKEYAKGHLAVVAYERLPGEKFDSLYATYVVERETGKRWRGTPHFDCGYSSNIDYIERKFASLCCDIDAHIEMTTAREKV